MAIALDGISITAFRSYQNDVAFHFPTDPGVYMFSGEIGIGKSSIFEALRWVFTGALSSGLRAKQVANWAGTEQTQVVLDIRASGRLRAVTRRYGPNSLTLQKGLGEPKTVEQPEIDRLFGTTAVHVMDAVYMAQRGDSFMSIGSTRQAERVAQTLGLERWDARTAAAKKSAKAAAGDLKAAKLVTAGKQGGLIAIEGSLRQLIGLSNAFKAAAADRKLTLQTAQWVKNREQCVLAANEKRRGALSVHMAALQDAKSARRKLGEAEPGTLCGTCDAPLSAVALATGRERYIAAGEACELAIAAGLEAAQALAVREEIETKADAAHEAARGYAAQGLRDNAEFDDEIAAIDIIVETANPYQEQLKTGAQERKQLQAAIEASKEVEHKAEQDQALAELAAKTFPRVKLSILARASSNMSTLTNNALSALGLVGWSVQWATSAVIGSGETRAKFAMTVKSPESPDWVDWKAWSGGQSTLLRIAGAAAYADLVRSRLKEAPDFEIWDEPGEYLNERSGLAVMAFFRHRATTLKHKVWVVDHNTQFAGEVDRHWVVSRRSTGSYISPA